MAKPKPSRRAARRTIQETDVLIVGGGLAGSALAAALGGTGVGAIAVDREDPARLADQSLDGRVTAIAFATKRMFEAIGVWQDMAPRAAPIEEIRIVDGRSPLFLHYDRREIGDDPLGWMVENGALRRALHRATARGRGVGYRAPDRVVRLERNAEGVEAELASGLGLRARLAVAADGRDSETRAAAGIRCTAWSYGQTAIVLVAEHDAPQDFVAIEHFRPAGPFAILPMKGHRSAIVWTERDADVPGLLALPAADFDELLQERFGDFRGRVRCVSPKIAYPLRYSHAETYVAERLALVADAAHGLHPVAGQGINVGFRDVAVLAEKLVAAKRAGEDVGGRALLAAYERARRFDVLTMAVATDGIVRLFSNDLAPIRIVRDLGLGLVERMPALKRVFMRHAMGTLGTLPKLLAGSAL
jgi:2-octaprenyl-6-methoxyphenol hydroxylase